MPPLSDQPKNTRHGSSRQNVKHSNNASTSTPKQEEQPAYARQAIKKANITEQKKQPDSETSPLDRISLKINQPATDPETDSEHENQGGTDKPVKAFTYETFFEAWKKIALTYKDGSPGLYMAMMKNKPLLKTDWLFEVFTDNAIQRDLFLEKKPEILRTLHQELNNYSIDVVPEIKATKKKDIAYLPVEKLQKLIDKNPAVEKMKNIFGLDLDY